MKPLKVNEVNSYIKRIFSGDMILSNLEIEGEIANFKHHYSGHMYFSLKDEKSKIRCIMFKDDNESLDIQLVEGMKVIAKGYISVYEREGDFQLYVRSIKDKGVGDLYKAFEKLKEKLSKEGLFDTKYKKELPFLPKNIGIVTSSTGAAIRDIISIIKRRYPLCNLTIYPTLVQGVNAPQDIIKGLNHLDNRGDIDLIIVGRGGGSIEDLSAFNDEELARTIFNLNTPVISAVGHETDFTISDFVADLRAPTPSAAAELAVPDMSHLATNLENKFKSLNSIYLKWIKHQEHDLKIMERALKYNNPVTKLKDKKQDLDSLYRDINYFMEVKISTEAKRMVQLDHRLKIMDPQLSLKKGYGIIHDNQGNIIKSIEEVKIDEALNILMQDGTVKTIVINLGKGGMNPNDCN